MRALFLAALLSTTCAAHGVPVQPTSTPHVWIPAGVPDDVVICVALQQRQQWACRTVGELRQILSTLAKL